jgi:hypothetical protein
MKMYLGEGFGANPLLTQTIPKSIVSTLPKLPFGSANSSAPIPEKNPITL